jgi:group II intron reverse transcriptase/maturase
MLENNKRPHVVEIDFASFFNTIPHKNLIRILSKRISDNRFKGLIGRFLISGVMDQHGTLVEPDAGTPQGSIMSPILANIYLHYTLDQWFEEEYNPPANGMIRYADDAIFLFQKESDAQHFEQELKRRTQQFGLQLNNEKTRIVQFERNSGNDFDFLGFTFYWGPKPVKSVRKLKVKTRKQTLFKKIQDFAKWIKEARNKRKEKELWGLAKAKLIGHYNYYGYASNRPALSRFYWEALASLFRWLNRRSQKKSFSWEKFRDKAMAILPKPYPMAKLKHLKWSPLCYTH